MPREMTTKPGTLARNAVIMLCQRIGCADMDARADLGNYAHLKDLSMLELARHCLEEAGERTGAVNSQDLLSRALTTSDFPSILQDTANKAIEKAYKAAAATFGIWTSKGAVQNFKTGTVTRFSPPSNLPEILEDDEYNELACKDGEEVFKIKTWGGILSISRHAIINDDLSVFKDVPRVLGITTKSTQSHRVYSRLLSNPVLSDGLNVFAEGRGNYLVGAETILGRDSLARAVKTMRMMTDASGNQLSVEPKYLLVPASLEMTAHELCFSDSAPGQNNSAVPNFFKKLGLTPVVEPLLENPQITGNSAAAWYLFPDPDMYPVFRTLALGSEENLEPYIDSAVEFKTDALRYKVRTDFECAPVGWMAVKSKGAA